MIVPEMALSGELVQHIKQKKIMGDGGSGSSFSLNRSVLGEIYLSEVLEQPGHMALPYVKHTENSASMNCEVILADSPRTEMLAVKISKKKKRKKKKKKDKSTKSLNDKTVDGTGLRKCGLDSAMPSCQLSGETANDNATNYVKGLKNDLPSAGVNPQCAPCMSGVCKDPSVPIGKNLPECSNVRIPDLTGNYFPASMRNHSNSGSNICCALIASLVRSKIALLATVELPKPVAGLRLPAIIVASPQLMILNLMTWLLKVMQYTKLRRMPREHKPMGKKDRIFIMWTRMFAC